MTADWPSTLGAEKAILSEPSLLTAEPRITPCTVSPSAIASDSRLSTTMPPPLPHNVPFASASNERQWPSGERMPPSWWV